MFLTFYKLTFYSRTEPVDFQVKCQIVKLETLLTRTEKWLSNIELTEKSAGSRL